MATATVVERDQLVEHVTGNPQRAKTKNVRRDPHVSVLVMGDDFGSAWVQIDGEGEVIDMPEAADPLVEYYRAISGEHPDWDEYRRRWPTRASRSSASA
jgi:hypothetical protein